MAIRVAIKNKGVFKRENAITRPQSELLRKNL